MNLLRMLILLSATGICFGQAADVKPILAKMDATAASFRDLTAQMKRLTHTAVINDNSTEIGTMTLYRNPKGEVRARVDFTQPDPKSVGFAGRKIEMFYPKLNLVQEYDFSKQGKLVDQAITLLLLGFGTSGKDLLRDYNVQLLGLEKVGDRTAAKLQLIPKQKAALERLTKAELLIDPTTGYPVEQKFYLPSGDYNIVTYTDPKVNTGLTEQAALLKLPANVKREQPQKQ